MKKIFLILSVTLLIVAVSCKKQAGEGGQATIKGKVLERKMTIDFSHCQGQYNAAEKAVYIVYGDDASYGNKTQTEPDGTYEFRYLRKGSYKIYVYGNDSAGTIGPPINASAPKIAVFKTVEITSRKQTVDAGISVIYN